MKAGANVVIAKAPKYSLPGSKSPPSELVELGYSVAFLLVVFFAGELEPVLLVVFVFTAGIKSKLL